MSSRILSSVAVLCFFALNAGCGETAVGTDVPGSGGNVMNTGGTSPIEGCPYTAPQEGTSCAEDSTVGTSCRFGEQLVDYLCTADGTWTKREFIPVAAGGAGGSGTTAPSDIGTTETVDCEAFSLGECPAPQCAAQCCGDGSDSGGCAGCCMPAFCEQIPADECPLSRCDVKMNCAGEPICTNQLKGPPPECGALGYYGQEVACCAGLTATCAKQVGDMCDPEAGYQGGLAMCLACGDGTCETSFETECNCPEDCAP